MVDFVTYFEELLERFSLYLADLRARLGAWMVDFLGKLGRLVVRALGVALKLLILMLCPYFAWASVGEYFFWNSGFILGGIGALVVLIFPIFALVDALRTVASSFSRGARAQRSASPAQVASPAPEVADEQGESWWSTMATRVVRMFVSERGDIHAYYSIFVGVAILVTIMMFTFASGLAKTFFGNLNIIILAMIFLGPKWLITSVYGTISGTSFHVDTSALKRVLGLAPESELSNLVWPLVLGCVSIVAIGWIWYWLKRHPKTSVAEASLQEPALGQPAGTANAQPRDEGGGGFAAFLLILIVIAGLVALAWFTGFFPFKREAT